MSAHERLLRIAQAHSQIQMSGGIVSGYCSECDRVWPCPTFIWSTHNRDVLDTWDPDDAARYTA